jgi:hypothetical protein
MPEVQEQKGGASLHAILREDISQVLGGKNLGLDSYRQHAHAFSMPRFAIGFNEGEVPATAYVHMPELGYGRVQFELAFNIGLNDVGETIGLRHGAPPYVDFTELPNLEQLGAPR